MFHRYLRIDKWIDDIAIARSYRASRRVDNCSAPIIDEALDSRAIILEFVVPPLFLFCLVSFSAAIEKDAVSPEALMCRSREKQDSINRAQVAKTARRLHRANNNKALMRRATRRSGRPRELPLLTARLARGKWR